MAKKPNKAETKLGADTGTANTTETAAATPAAPKSRGPRGVPETATIKVLSTVNPKRPNTKAHNVFGHYVDGMTVKAFADALEADALGKEATPNLVYDAKHGFISIDGYDPGAIVVAKPKAPKKEKPVKGTTPADDAAAVTAGAEAVAETME